MEKKSRYGYIYEVTVTNRYGRRAGLRLAQPSGAFAVKPTSDFAMR